jgi:hypothetical protein
LASPDGRTYSQTDQSPDRWKMTVKYIWGLIFQSGWLWCWSLFASCKT